MSKADFSQVKETNELDILDGVTTNLSLMTKEGIKSTGAILDGCRTICGIVEGDISAEEHRQPAGALMDDIAGVNKTNDLVPMGYVAVIWKNRFLTGWEPLLNITFLCDRNLYPLHFSCILQNSQMYVVKRMRFTSLQNRCSHCLLCR